MTTTRQSKVGLNVAVVGGGIAGVLLIVALLKHCPNLNLTLYESASAFGEIGAGVGFQPVMVRTMAKIDPRIAAAFEKCTQGNEESDPPIWFTVRVSDERKKGVKTGGEVFKIPSRKGPRGGVHRAHFLDELVKLIPYGIAVFGKRVVDVKKAKDASGDAVLHFSDGSTAQHTAIFGCDGIKSRIRPIVLANSQPAPAVFSGKYVYRGLLPMDKAIQIMGGDEHRTPQLHMGYHGHLITFPIAGGNIMNVVGFASKSTWEDAQWVARASREDIMEDFQHWDPKVRNLMADVQKPDIWALYDHLPASTYYSAEPLVCLVGDAAHASTPHQGSGAGMCVEDVYILSQLLSKCPTRHALKTALRAYDAVRRPRSQKVVKTSREAGQLWDLEGEGVGDNLQILEQNATTRMSWIWDYDISVDLQAAQQMVARVAIT